MMRCNFRNTCFGLILALCGFTIHAAKMDRAPLTITLASVTQKQIKSCSSKAMAVCSVFLQSGPGELITITNNSSTETAANITVHDIPVTALVTQDASQCARLLPNSSCQIMLTAAMGAPPQTYLVSVYGDNTAPVEIELKVNS